MQLFLGQGPPLVVISSIRSFKKMEIYRYTDYGVFVNEIHLITYYTIYTNSQ